MKERPMLFNADMVNAILEGRKTQTRRVKDLDLINTDPESFKQYGVCYNEDGDKYLAGYWKDFDSDIYIKCPYGEVGDQLWVRETLYHQNKHDNCKDNYFYRADDTKLSRDFYPELFECFGYDKITIPSIHMPRWASRIQLEITDITIERLDDTSEDDAKAEGISWIDHGWKDYLIHFLYFWSPIDGFKSLWESINGKGSWDLNPWVWVVEFKVIKRGDSSE